MIKAIIFDFFGVICSDEYWNYVKEKKASGGKFSHLGNELNLGNLHWEEFLEKIAKATGHSKAELQALYTSQGINPEIVAYIDALHSKYKTALLTNANSEQLNPIIEKTKIMTVFDEIIVSSDLGIVKPDPRIFEYALDKLGVKPHEAVFIDDIKRYLTGAQSLGIKSIWYQGFNQMKKDLEIVLKA